MAFDTANRLKLRVEGMDCGVETTARHLQRQRECRSGDAVALPGRVPDVPRGGRAAHSLTRLHPTPCARIDFAGSHFATAVRDCRPKLLVNTQGTTRPRYRRIAGPCVRCRDECTGTG